jgi:hypothetical protein
MRDEQRDGCDAFWENLPGVAKAVFSHFENKYGRVFHAVQSDDDPNATISFLRNVQALAEYMNTQHTRTYVVDAYTIDAAACTLRSTEQNRLPRIEIQLSPTCQLPIANTAHKIWLPYSQFLANLMILINAAYDASSPPRMIQRYDDTDRFFVRHFLPMVVEHMCLTPAADSVATLHLEERFFRELRVLIADVNNVVAITSACELALNGFTPERWEQYNGGER